ncbi:hypothetical protein DFP72DRAFT_816363 [Ephemerocybe angulata]|uniref:Uncharacterized protein n=1 Tax=Ephemerocybe angulata TaxID=980116 RepID=A0A8H6HQU1_9AGAR|nr:hypothetical protein DFP72DRAFT_816363 [Tulosesus angulatus]
MDTVWVGLRSAGRFLPSLRLCVLKRIEETELTSTNTSSASPPPIPSPIADSPSPLLCPRRAFLAALIVASQFTPEKCHSNRARAKLSRLPPREIGHCERALGSALA